MHIFHKWSKWEQYEWVGSVTGVGVLLPKELRGKRIPIVESRQSRICEICGKMQDEEI